MIISIRGANGSGKSTAVRKFVHSVGGFERLLARFEPGRRTRPIYYRDLEGTFALVGHYESQCGGADNIPFRRVAPLTVALARRGHHVIYESMLFSVETKQLFLMAEQVRDIRVLHLITSVEQCVENIHRRRAITGRRLGTGLDVARIKKNHDRIWQVRDQLVLHEGITCPLATVDEAARLIGLWVKERRV